MSIGLKVLYRLHRGWLSLSGAVTLGTRAIVIVEDQVLLVRLTYHHGWHLPGGRVDKGESFEEAFVRELKEECGIQSLRHSLHGVYLSRGQGRTDHVAVYVVEEFSGEALTADSREIAEARFFPLDRLPNELLAGHRRRLEEFSGARTKQDKW